MVGFREEIPALNTGSGRAPSRYPRLLQIEIEVQGLSVDCRGSQLSEVPQFQTLTGDQAFQLKRQLEQAGLNDPDFGHYRSNWGAMLAVLQQKFAHGMAMASLLRATGDAFLLEHNSTPGRDKIWCGLANL